MKTIILMLQMSLAVCVANAQCKLLYLKELQRLAVVPNLKIELEQMGFERLRQTDPHYTDYVACSVAFKNENVFHYSQTITYSVKYDYVLFKTLDKKNYDTLKNEITKISKYKDYDKDLSANLYEDNEYKYWIGVGWDSETEKTHPAYYFTIQKKR